MEVKQIPELCIMGNNTTETFLRKVTIQEDRSPRQYSYLVNVTIGCLNATFQNKYRGCFHGNHNQSETECGQQTQETWVWHQVLESGQNLTHTLIGSLQGKAQNTKPTLCQGRARQSLADNKL